VVTLATCSLAGCFGCHMSLLDIDERLLPLLARVTLDRSPLTDKKAFDGPVDIGLVEGGCATEHDVAVLQEFRRHCTLLVAVGACATTGGVPAMRNGLPLAECLAEGYLQGPTSDDTAMIPAAPELPRLLDRVYACQEFVPIDLVLPGCPPSADAIWTTLTQVLDGTPQQLPYRLRKFE
jgi:NAD-reducing hydrogenase small subunit